MPSQKNNTTSRASASNRSITRPAPVRRTASQPAPAMSNDAMDNRALGALAYFWIFCVIPLVAKKDSPFAQFHAKQGVVLAFAWFVLWMINIIPLLGTHVFIIGIIPLTAVNIMAIVKAWNGEKWEIPYLFHYVKMLNL